MTNPQKPAGAASVSNKPVPAQSGTKSAVPVPADIKQKTLQLAYTWKPAKYYTKGRTGPVQAIIVHSTEGRESSDLDVLINGDVQPNGSVRKVSVHWYITRTGKIYHMVDDADTAYHAGMTVQVMYSNGRTVGIEHEHYDGKEDWPEAQVLASARLIAYLKSKHGNVPVVTHSVAAAPPGRKSDPVLYPFSNVNKLVAGLADTHISAALAA